MKSLRTSTAVAGIAALTLLDISAATPAQAQGVPNPFQGNYLGAHTGFVTTDSMSFTGNPYTVGQADGFTDNNIPISGRNDKFEFDGGLVGVHAGSNFVTQGNVLIGIEGGWTYLGISDTERGSESAVVNTDGYTFQHRSEVELEWQGTIRGRLGFVSGNALFFATAGIAFLDATWKETATAIDDDAGATFVRNHSSDEILTGSVVGVGVEFAVAPNVIVGGDYLYENFETFGNVPFGHSITPQTGRLGDLDVHKLRVRVSIKLGGGTP